MVSSSISSLTVVSGSTGLEISSSTDKPFCKFRRLPAHIMVEVRYSYDVQYAMALHLARYLQQSTVGAQHVSHQDSDSLVVTC